MQFDVRFEAGLNPYPFEARSGAGAGGRGREGGWLEGGAVRGRAASRQCAFESSRGWAGERGRCRLRGG